MISSDAMKRIVAIVGCLASMAHAGEDRSGMMAVSSLDTSSKSHRIIRVSNMGVDAADCGSQPAPCRTISRAITNATDGDTIVVGPGTYGDLDEDEVLGGYNEESGSVTSQCNCLVLVDKRIKVISEYGAAVTLLDGLGGGENKLYTGVMVTASDAIFGEPEHGFTIINMLTSIVVSGSATGVTVSGNIQDINPNGMSVQGARNLVSDNLSLRDKISIEGSDNTVRSNSSIGGGFISSGENNFFWGNSAIGSLIGLGFRIAGGSATLTRNSALGLLSPGIEIASGATAEITQNNLFGNGIRHGYLEDPRRDLNCGLHNDSGFKIDARYNFWGTTNGPGRDPSDAVCTPNGVTLAYPFSEKMIDMAIPVSRW